MLYTAVYRMGTRRRDAGRVNPAAWRQDHLYIYEKGERTSNVIIYLHTLGHWTLIRAVESTYRTRLIIVFTIHQNPDIHV